MFVWIGIDVDSQLADIKEGAQDVEKKVGFDHSNFTLPLHISLKITFPVDDALFDAVKADIIKVFDEFEPFNITVDGIEFEDTICWILMERNPSLDGIHDRLNEVMLQKYGVPLHEYDMDYKFHTTLFMDDDIQRVDEAYELICGAAVPEVLYANKFVIGTSDTGALGTYKVVYEHTK